MDGSVDGGMFVVTKQHRRFAEFADACRHDRYIGLCYGAPGVGKTLSARQYARWDELTSLLPRWEKHFTLGKGRPDWHTLVYTPTVHATPRVISKDLQELGCNLAAIRTHDPCDPRTYGDPYGSPPFVELLIIDEADRLKMAGLEQLRDHYDRSQLGLILIGMPGIEKRLARYPSCTAGWGSSTTTSRSAPRSRQSFSPGTGRSSASATRTTTPPPRRSPRSRASPVATSGSSAACSHRPNASWRSTSCTP